MTPPSSPTDEMASLSYNNWPPPLPPNATHVTHATMTHYSYASTCDDYVDAMVALIRADPNLRSNESVAITSSYVLRNIAGPAVCAFGIIGNVLNLIVLSRKQLQRSMDDMERSVSVGLIALAAADMVFCALFMTVSLLPDRIYYSPYDSRARLYFHTYYESVLNVFTASSTWLTVNMALGRYIAICYPLHARGFVDIRVTRLVVVGIFVASMLINLPRFWQFEELATTCEKFGPPSTLQPPITMTLGEGENVTAYVTASCNCFYRQKIRTNVYKLNKDWFVYGYGALWTVLVVFIPLIVLTVCNVCLVRALRRSYRLQSLYRANKSSTESSGHRITPTLIAIIVLFMLLVVPSEIVSFCRPYTNYKNLATAIDVTNFLLTINFSVNFILYCVVNAQFRKIVRDVLFCGWCHHRDSDHASSYSCACSCSPGRRLLCCRSLRKDGSVRSEYSPQRTRSTFPCAYCSDTEMLQMSPTANVVHKFDVEAA